MGIFRKLKSKEVHKKEGETYRKNMQRKEDATNESKVLEDGTRVDENGVYEVIERTIYPEKIICPDCGGVTTEGLEFCDKCAGEL